jgi:hypothetical protein
VAQAGLELLILLPQLPQGWDYRHEVAYFAHCSELIQSNSVGTMATAMVTKSQQS